MATSTFALPTFSPFDAHADGNTGQRWKKWLGRFERLLIAMNIEEKKQQRAMLLHQLLMKFSTHFQTLVKQKIMTKQSKHSTPILFPK